jgi:hypothetical protein
MELIDQPHSINILQDTGGAQYECINALICGGFNEEFDHII